MQPVPGELLAHIYDAALDERGWSKALEGICRYLDTAAMTIVALDPAWRSAALMLHHGFAEEVMRDYQRALIQVDPLRAYVAAHPEQRLVLEEHHSPEEKRKTSAYHQTMERLSGITYRFAARLFEESGFTTYITMSRNRAQGAPDATVLGRFSRLLPHVERAVRIAFRLGSLELQTRAAGDVLQDLATGVCLVDAEARLLYVNAAAEAILGKADAIHAEGGTLAGVTRPANARVRELLRDASDPERPAAGFTALHRAGGKRPYALQVTPIDPRRQPFATLRPTACVFLSDPENEPSASDEVLRDLFALTRRQAELVRHLVRGEALKEAAYAMGITEKTARVHLEQVLRKTCTRRQSELMSLLATLCM